FPPTPATGSTEGRSFPKRPAFPFVVGDPAKNTGKEKGDGNAVAFLRSSNESSWPSRGTSRDRRRRPCRRRRKPRSAPPCRLNRLRPRACRKRHQRSCWPPG